MDFAFTPQEETFRTELRGFLTQELPPDHWRLQSDREEDQAGSREFRRAFVKKLAARGWLTLHWPKEYGGLGASPMQQLIFSEEMSYHAAPTGGMGVSMVGPTLIHHGTAEQRAQHLSAIAAADEIWCQGFSEPGAGSDLASLQTRALPDGDDYLVNGQKIWTSGAHDADWCMLLVRTDPEAPKHKGISFLMMPMGSPGIEIRPLINALGSHAFNELFLQDVRIPRRNLVGEENRGWYVATTTLDYERSGIDRVMWCKRILEEMIDHARRVARARSEPVPALLRDQLADLWITVEAARLLAYRVTWQQAQGQVPNYEASMSKLFVSELSQALTRVGINMLGPWGALRRGSPGAADAEAALPLLGAMAEGYLATLSYTIAAGTSEIQRNIIATRGLGLPRA